MLNLNQQERGNFKRILIVDDEPFNIMALKILLNSSGHDNILSIVETAVDGQEAVDKVKEAHNHGQFSYGLIFMDISMPILNGFKASEQIRTYLHAHSLPQPMIVACTGHTEPEYRKLAWFYQMDEIIFKPVH